ncbi:MAG: 3-keto-disaccharide hydrolase, partial [Limisphaerales bacterium]
IKGCMNYLHRLRVVIPAVLLASAVSAVSAQNPYVGEWALTIPGGAAGWLGVHESGGQLEGSMMWGWGSVEPVDSVKIEADRLVVTRKHEVERKDAQGKTVKTSFIETITATVKGDAIHLTSTKPRENGRGDETVHFDGHRQPPVPPAPDLSAVKFGDAIELFNGKDLTGWRLTDPHAVSGWSVENGDLVNHPVQEKGKHKNYGNLRTDREFEDFNLKVEVKVEKGENSGVYVRGIYEVQVADTYGKPLDPHNMGGVYSRITPSVAAEKPPGEWQTLDITFVDRHMTVILNGTRIIDNQPVLGCTGGALWSDVTKPGPIYIQGDHTGIEYRSLVLRPVVR